jgi:hypothetical protein
MRRPERHPACIRSVSVRAWSTVCWHAYAIPLYGYLEEGQRAAARMYVKCTAVRFALHVPGGDSMRSIAFYWRRHRRFSDRAPPLRQGSRLGQRQAVVIARQVSAVPQRAAPHIRSAFARGGLGAAHAAVGNGPQAGITPPIRVVWHQNSQVSGIYNTMLFRPTRSGRAASMQSRQTACR